MILEVAILSIKLGKEVEFENDFKIASQYISSSKGYKNHSLKKSIEKENQYILLVEWDSLEDHTIGFRNSDQYLKWKNLLHHYYEPFPLVEHYRDII
jgi:heme-degrading monooxygenase HmoA